MGRKATRSFFPDNNEKKERLMRRVWLPFPPPGYE